MQFSNLMDKHYIIRPCFLHSSWDTPWLLSVDCMTALECICCCLGPHMINIANFLISHGVHFHTLQHISDSPNSEESFVHPPIRYLSSHPANHSFNLLDFVGYEDFVIHSFVHSHMGRLLCVKVVSLHAWQGRFSQIPMLFPGLLLKH